MEPLVAVTTTLGSDPARPGGPDVLLRAAYVAALERAGLAALLLTPVHSLGSVRALLARAAGLVLTGGEDVDPARYGARPAPGLGAVSPARDALEFAALEEALARGLPVLGICRGCQVLNVHLGGTLYQDIASERPDALPHRPAAPGQSAAHRVRVEPGSRLARILGATELRPESFHHQAIRELAPGLRAVAWSEDGLVEAVESADDAWLVGVQWHPERAAADGTPEDDPDRRLFTAFREAARARAARGS